MIYYTLEEPTKTGGIFLAGPSLRPGQKGTSWRPEVIRTLKLMKMSPIIYVPEFRPPSFKNFDGSQIETQGGQPEGWTYEKQVEWEVKCLALARTILFWIPRSEKLPGFTTNIEFGEWLHSDKIVIGFPEDAINMRYIFHRCKMRGMHVHKRLETLCQEAIDHNWSYNAERRDH